MTQEWQRQQAKEGLCDHRIGDDVRQVLEHIVEGLVEDEVIVFRRRDLEDFDEAVIQGGGDPRTVELLPQVAG